MNINNTNQNSLKSNCTLVKSRNKLTFDHMVMDIF